MTKILSEIKFYYPDERYGSYMPYARFEILFYLEKVIDGIYPILLKNYYMDYGSSYMQATLKNIITIENNFNFIKWCEPEKIQYIKWKIEHSRNFFH